MKKSIIIFLLLILVFVFGLCSCSNSDIPATIDQEPQQSSEKQLKNNNQVRCIKQTYYDGDIDSPISYWREYEYDEFGNQIKEIEYTADGVVDGWNEYEYDEFGNKTKATFYDSTGSKKSWSEYEYDEAGKGIGYSAYYINNGTAKLKYKYTEEYNADGEIIIGKYIWSNNYVREKDYEYDSNGKLIRITTSDTNSPNPTWEEFEYDNEGTIKRKYFYNEEGDIIGWYEPKYEYDDDGNIIRYTDTYYKQDGSVGEYTIIDFNEFEEYSKYTDYYADGTVRRTILYDYECMNDFI